MSICLNINHSNKYLHSQIVSHWKNRDSKDVDIHIVDPMRRNEYMAVIHCYLNKKKLIEMTYNADAYFTYRGYYHKCKHNYTDYKDFKQIVWDISGDVFYNQLVRFLDYCRSIRITDDVLECERLSLKWLYAELSCINYTAHDDWSQMKLSSPVENSMFLHLLSE
jgi:hypothetical protein